MALLNLCGKDPSDNAKLMILVMGCIKESRQDLRRKVGIVSRQQVAFEDIRIALRTSSELDGEKVVRDGGIVAGGKCGEEPGLGVRDEDNLTILSLKKLRKEFARVKEDIEVGRTG